MTTRDTEITAALRGAIGRRLGAADFSLWLADGQALACDGKTLRVAAGSQFKLDRIKTHHRAALEAASAEVLGRVLPLVFVVENVPCQPQATQPKSRDAEETGGPGGSGDLRGKDKAGVALHAQQRRFASLRTFIVGEGSRVAYASCEMVVDRPGEMNPLYLHGPPGTGKTHLLEGVWCEVRRRKLKHVLYLSAEQFTSHFLEALKNRTGLPSFRRKYRGADVLILDDVQFFVGKKATITELQHTVDDMLRGKRQIVLAANCPPGALAALGPALVARLSSGMVCGLQPAERETRLAIARQMAASRKLDVPREALAYIADHLPGDARQIGGALNRLAACSQAWSRPMDLALAREALADLVRASRWPVHLCDIERAVCEEFGLDANKLQSPQKSKAVAHPRMLAMYLARKHTRAALSEIGAHFGRRSHTTVVCAEKAVQGWLGKQAALHLNGRTWSVDEAIRHIEGRLRLG